MKKCIAKPTLLLSTTALLISILLVVSCGGGITGTITVTNTQTSTITITTTEQPGTTLTLTTNKAKFLCPIDGLQFDSFAELRTHFEATHPEAGTEITWFDIPTYNEFWGTIRVDVGEEFAITLNQHPRMGYGWYATYDENLHVLLASDFKEYSTSIGGGNGDQYFIFKALQQGSTQINFIYRHVYPESEVLEEKVFNIAIEAEESTGLSQNQQLWNSKNISDYSYHLQVGTGFRPPRTADVIITVRDGVTTGYEEVGDPQNPNPDHITPYSTFEKMFDLLRQAYQVEGDQVAVTYDSTFGFPAWSTSYSIDNPRGIHFAITISDFTPVLNPVPQLISPEPGAVFTNNAGESSEILLKSIQVNKDVSDEQYFPPWGSSHTVNVGDPILIVRGTIQNKHKENTWIDMWAEGYDEMGEQVAWTLDDAHLSGHILLNLETEETGEFIIHLNYPYNVNSIRIYANNYPIVPP
ncbi:DUF6174 domain-containing protein [Chloroflexota bacterium]